MDKLGSDPNYQPRVSSHLGTSNLGPRVSSLGGIVPEGAEVRRWNSGRPTDGVHHVDNPSLTCPAGRERPASSGQDSPRGLPAQIVGRDDGFGGQHLKHLQTPIQLPKEGVNIDKGKSAQSHRSSASEAVASVHPTVHASKRLPVIDETLATGCAPNYATSWLPPHLRKTSGYQPASSQSHTVTQQVSSQLSEATPEVSVLSENSIRKLTTLHAREIFYQKDVRVFRQGGADSKPSNGRIVLYELLNSPDGIWELTIDDKKVIRGDIRNLQEMLTDGSKAFIRRINKGRVQSDHIRFTDINEAKIFKNEVNFRRSQYAPSPSTHAETIIELSPVNDAVTAGTAVQPTKTLGNSTAFTGPAEPLRQYLAPACFESPQPQKVDLEKRTADKCTAEAHTAEKHTAETHTAETRAAERHTVEEHPAEKLKRSWATIGSGRRKNKFRPRTPPIALTKAALKATPATPTREETDLGWHDDLIRLSPYSSDEYSQSGEPVKHEPSQLAVAERPSLWEEADYSSGPLSEQQVELGELIHINAGNEEHEGQQKKRLTAVEATRALRDIKIVEDISVLADRFGNPLQLPWINPEDYSRLARKSELLAMALTSSSSPTRSAVFLTCLLHLVEIDEFLSMPHDEQKKSLATLYTIMRQSAPRIVRTQDEILALRSSAEPCPEAIKEFNALVKGGKGSGHEQRKPTSQPPPYNPEIVVWGASANHAFLYGHHKDDSLIGQTAQDTTVTKPESISKHTSSLSSNMSGKGTKGLSKSCWASVEAENLEQQSSVRHEEIPTQYPPSSLGMGRVGNEAGRDCDRKADSHGRLATLDTMAILADQLESLSLGFKHNHSFGAE